LAANLTVTSNIPAAEDVPQHVHFTVNLDGLRLEMQESIQTIINLVALSLSGDVAQVERLELPGSRVQTTFHAHLNWDADERRSRREAWVLANAVRDCAESLSSFLESARNVLASWALGDLQKVRVIQRNDYRQAFEADALEFHELGLPGKILTIRNVYGLAVDEELSEQVLSINAARNCLVHRGGVVGPKDLKGKDVLRIHHRRMRTTFLGDDGTRHELRIGETTKGPGQIQISFEDTERTFALGERLTFTTDDLDAMCWGLFMFAEKFVADINANGIARGYVTPAAPSITAASPPSSSDDPPADPAS
jgi:hypothetical protein